MPAVATAEHLTTQEPRPQTEGGVLLRVVDLPPPQPLMTELPALLRQKPHRRIESDGLLYQCIKLDPSQGRSAEICWNAHWR